MHKRKQEAILCVRKYKLQTEPQKYHHSKLILFYPWKNEDDLIMGFSSYMESYIDKQDVVHKNAKSFNEDCERFHPALEAFENDVIPQSAWDSIVPTIAEEKAVTNTQGFQTIQMTTEEEEYDDTIVTRHGTNVQVEIDPVSRLYAKVACTHMVTFQDCCSRMQSLNRKQCEIVMYNRAWCKSYTQGFQTIQMTTEEEKYDDTIVTRHGTNVQVEIDPVSRLYAKVACTHMMTFQDCCSRMQSLNRKQCEIVMYSRAWCKSYIDGMQHGQKLNGFQLFMSGFGGTGKSHVLQLIQQDVWYMLNNTINPNDDQPLVLVTAPTGSAAFQVGRSTIHSAFLLYDKSRTKPSWEKCSIMQLKLQKLMLSITDEISMVSFKQYQQMNETMCIVKGTCNGNWGGICVLAVGNLYQLPPVGQSPIYLSPHTAHTLDDFAPKWMGRHEVA